MNRTQIYLSDEQLRRVRQRAKDAGMSQAAVIRQILDAGLGIAESAATRVDAVLETAGMLPEAEDWPDWLARVRGRSADKRLEELGL